MDAKRLEVLSVAEQAAHWLRVMETVDIKKRKDFWEWMSASPLHVRELLLAVRLDQSLNAIDPERRIDVAGLIAQAGSGVVPLAARAAEPPKPGARPRFSDALPKIAAAAVLAITAVGIGFWISGRGEHYSTRVGEQRVFELSDGSVIYLNTQSRVHVRYGVHARDIDLQRGQALFQVARSTARPFRVHAAGVIIQALGTQFDVRLNAGQTTVAVMEGAIQVLSQGSTESIGAPARVDAGEGIAIDNRGQIRRTPQIDSEAVSAWRRQRLIFRNDDLATIVTEFNRYNASPRLRIEGDALRDRRFHGTFNAHSPESLLTYLAGDSTLQIDRDDREVVIRERKRSY